LEINNKIWKVVVTSSWNHQKGDTHLQARLSINGHPNANVFLFHCGSIFPNQMTFQVISWLYLSRFHEYGSIIVIVYNQIIFSPKLITIVKLSKFQGFQGECKKGGAMGAKAM
jgi:hypothetical protein